MSSNQKYTPCGGCGATEPSQRCIGCFHPFEVTKEGPVALYRWLLANYAKPGQRILDTHLGSGSIAIACHYFGAHLTACEIDPDYFAAACERIDRETRQADMFAPKVEEIQAALPELTLGLLP